MAYILSGKRVSNCMRSKSERNYEFVELNETVKDAIKCSLLQRFQKGSVSIDKKNQIERNMRTMERLDYTMYIDVWYS